MNDQPLSDAQCISSTSREEGAADVRYNGAFFPNAQHFVVAGGTFTNVTNVTRPNPVIPTDFRMIPLGDLDLRHEIRLDSDSGRIYHDSGLPLRRIHSARIYGHKFKVTAAVYQGEDAEEEWRHDILEHSRLRHPNVVQLWATMTSPAIHAAIWLDELIPAKQMLEEYSNLSPMLPVYVLARMELEFVDGSKYIQAVTGRDLFRDWGRYMTWIRPTTSCLRIELKRDSSDSCLIFTKGQTLTPRSTAPLLKVPTDSEILAAISLIDYHRICAQLQAQRQTVSVAKHDVVKLGTVHCGALRSDFDGQTEIVSGDLKLNSLPGEWQVFGGQCSTMENGWTRVQSFELMDVSIRFSAIDRYANEHWLAQANYIFQCLKATSNFQDYCLLEWIDYFCEGTTSIPSGYLFLCPSSEFKLDNPARFRIPECAAYWSLDPFGVHRMSADEAEDAGFPTLVYYMVVQRSRWSDSVYAGLRKFHAGKGFNPDSLEVARHLGCRLFKLSSAKHLEGPHAQQSDADDWDGPRLTDMLTDDESAQRCSPNSLAICEQGRTRTCIYLHGQNIVVLVQMALILTLGILWLHDDL